MPPQSAQLTALLAASVTCAYPDVSIDVAYGFSGAHHNDLAQRSMHSVIATASPATLARLRFHIFSDDAAYQEGTFGAVPMFSYRNVSVTKIRKVWDRRYSAKLEHSSNYVRFYVAAALRAREARDGRSHAEKFLYLDTDTLALHDVGPVLTVRCAMGSSPSRVVCSDPMSVGLGRWFAWPTQCYAIFH